MNTRLIVVLFLALLMDFVIALNTLAVPNLVMALGGGAGHVGMLSGLPWVFYVLACVYLAPLGDRIKAWKLMTWSALGYGFLLVPLLIVSTQISQGNKQLLIPLYIFLPLSTGCLGLFWPPLQRYLSENREMSDLNRTLRAFNIFWSLGIGLGLLLYGTLAKVNMALPYWVIIIGSLVIATGMLYFTRMPLVVSSANAPRQSLLAERRPSDWLQHLNTARIVNFMVHLIGTAAVSLFPVLAKARDIDGEGQSMITMFRGGMEMVAFLFMGFLRGQYYGPSLPVVSLVTAISGSILITIGNDRYMYMSGFALIGIGLGIAYALALIYSMDGHEDLSAKGGLHEAALASGIIIGPLICGAAGNWWGVRAPFWSAAILGTIALISLFLLPWTRGIFRKN